MKALLGALMCLVFTMTQAFAISGGPWGGGGNQVDLIGTYAGVLVPIVVVVNPGPPPVTLPPDKSLALFTVNLPQTGLGVGVTTVFRNGIFYIGAIVASGDPDTAKVSATVDATVIETVTCNDCNGVAHDYQYNFNANGKFDTVKAVTNQQSIATSSVRLRGQASLTYLTDATNSCDPACTAAFNAAGDSGGPIAYKVKGFKQSNGR